MGDKTATPRMDDAVTVGRRIITVRRERGLSRRALAVRASIVPRALQYWEGGRCYPSATSLCALADVLGLSVDALLGRVAAEVAP